MFSIKEWVYDNEKIPDWINEEASRGLVKIDKEDGDIIQIKLFTPTGTEIVNKGDAILLLKSGLVKLTKDQYNKFRNKNNNVAKKG